MRRYAAALLVLAAIACRSNPDTTSKTEVPRDEDLPREAVNPHQWGPYAYDPSWQDMKESYLAVTEIDFGAGHRLSECAGEFAATLKDVPDTVMFVSEQTKLVARNPYGDSFHSHLIAGQEDTLILSRDGRLETKGREGILVLVTSPYTVDSLVAKSIVPSTTLSIRLRKAEEAETLLPLQPFAAVAKTRDESAFLYITSQPHNEAEAIHGIYDPSRTQHELIKDANFAHGQAILLPRFVIDASDEGRIWQRVGTYPYPPDLAPDAAGTQFVSLEVKKDATPFQVVTAGRPVMSMPTKPVATRADIFTAFYGLADKSSYTFVSGYGYVAHPKPIMKVEAKDLKERTASMSIDLAAETDEERTVFLVHRLVARWKESGGMRAPQDEVKVKPAVYEVPKDRPVIRSNANGFVKQLKFLGKSGGAGGETSAVVPGSMISDLTSGMTSPGGNTSQGSSWNPLGTGGTVPSTTTTANSTSSTNVTNVYINVTHDDAASSIGGLPYTNSYVGPNTMSWRPENAKLSTGETYGPAQLRNQMMGKTDPYGNYYVDPRTGGVWYQGQPTSLEQWRQQQLTGNGGGSVDPIVATLGHTGYFLKKRKGWK